MQKKKKKKKRVLLLNKEERAPKFGPGTEIRFSMGNLYFLADKG